MNLLIVDFLDYSVLKYQQRSLEVEMYIVYFFISCLLQVCEKEVTVHPVEGDHESFITGKSAANVAEIINKHV